MLESIVTMGCLMGGVVLGALILVWIRKSLLFVHAGHVALVQQPPDRVDVRHGGFSLVKWPYDHLVHYRWSYDRQHPTDPEQTIEHHESGYELSMHRMYELDPAGIECKTRNGIKVTVDGILMYRIADYKKAIVDVDNLTRQLQTSIEIATVQVIKNYNHDELFGNHASIAMEIFQFFQNSVNSNYGVTCIEYKIEDISMDPLLETERERRHKQQVEAELARAAAEVERNKKILAMQHASDLANQQARVNAETLRREQELAQAAAEIDRNKKILAMQHAGELADQQALANAETLRREQEQAARVIQKNLALEREQQQMQIEQQRLAHARKIQELQDANDLADRNHQRSLTRSRQEAEIQTARNTSQAIDQQHQLEMQRLHSQTTIEQQRAVANPDQLAHERLVGLFATMRESGFSPRDVVDYFHGPKFAEAFGGIQKMVLSVSDWKNLFAQRFIVQSEQPSVEEEDE